MSDNEGPHETATSGADVAPTGTAAQSGGGGDSGDAGPARKRRRGSRGGRNRSKPKAAGAGGGQGPSGDADGSGSETSGSTSERSGGSGPAAGTGSKSGGAEATTGSGDSDQGAGGKVVPAGAPARPRIGDTLPAPAGSETESQGGQGQSSDPQGQSGSSGQTGQSGGSGRRRRRGGRGRGGGGGQQQAGQADQSGKADQSGRSGQSGQSGQKHGNSGSASKDGQPSGQTGQRDQKGQSGQKGQQQKSQKDSGSGNGGQTGSGKDRSSGGGRGQAAGAANGRNGGGGQSGQDSPSQEGQGAGSKRRRRRRRGGAGGQPPSNQPVEAVMSTVTVDEEELEKARETKSKGRYSMVVHVSEKAAQIATLEGRSMIEHYVSRPSDDISQIHGNIYLGRVQNVLPGMEAAFVDIGTPKNAVLYRGDVHYDKDDVERASQPPRIEKLLKAGQTIVCQVTKNPIGAKGARLTQEVSLPGRYVVLLPNSSTYGISKRLPDNERKRLRQVLDKAKPAEHGIIVRTAAEGASSDEIANDVRNLVKLWEQIDGLAKRSKAPSMLYREPDMTLRTIREEFNQDYRSVVIDDRKMYEDVRDYVASISPDMAARVEFYDPEKEKLPLFERYHVHEQLHRALDRKVWLPSGGSLIIEHTEALTVVDVNTGKNVGRSSLEETVFKNNLEAAVEIARQLRLRDIGGIIVIDYIDMEKRDNRDEVVRVFREALARDKTRTQVFEISELGLCEMTRKRIGEGLLESYSSDCPVCEGRGYVLDKELLPE